MAKKFSIKKLRLRSRAKRRSVSLAVRPTVKKRRVTLQENNRAVIRAIEEKMKAEQG